MKIKNLEKIEKSSHTCSYKINNENQNIYPFAASKSSILIHVNMVIQCKEESNVRINKTDCFVCQKCNK